MVSQKNKLSRYITLLGLLILGFTFTCGAQSMQEQAQNKIVFLQGLINEAELEGHDVLREKLAVRTAEVFLEFAEWDENNVEFNKGYFDMVHSTVEASQMAADLADFERNEVNLLLDDAIATIRRVINGDITRKATPDVDWEKVTVDGNQLTFEGRPVFLMDYTWKPEIDKLTEFYGQLDGFYIAPNHVLNKNGDINVNISSQLDARFGGTLGSIFIAHTNPPSWTLDEYGSGFNKFHGEPFHYYDIDNPGAREMMTMLLAGTIPKMAGKNYTKLGYMLANEPRWITHKDGAKKVWYSVDVSDYTKEKFKVWLEAKHTDIANLNVLWGTNFADFSDVTIETPIELSLHGAPKWYDWVTFNEDRVTDWFKFLRTEVLKHDPEGKTHNKIMPSFFTDNETNTGIDLEALTEISEINGNDAQVNHKMLWGKKHALAHKYSFDWRELFMGYDFLKSVQPYQINFNSESHLLSTNHSRDLYMKPDYVRAVHWAAHTLGLNATRMWFWPRNADGSFTGRGSNGYPGSNNQQPRVTNELHATIMDLNSFSEEIMAMQRQRKPIRLFYSKTSAKNHIGYMDDLFELYEALNFEGLPLGFATENIIRKQDNSNWDVILIHKTENVTLEELVSIQVYLDNGGTVIIDGSSIKKNEYGITLSSILLESNGTLFYVNSLKEMKSKALAIAENNNQLPKITISETSESGFKVCTWRCIKNSAGNNVLSIINLGKEDATLNIELNNAIVGTSCKDLLKGVGVTSNPTLKPNEVYFVEVTDGKGFTGVGNNINNDGFSATLYPNPSDGNFQVDLFKFHSEIDLQIFNMSGSLISSDTFSNVKTINYQILNESKGLYIVRLTTGEKLQSFLLMKN